MPVVARGRTQELLSDRRSVAAAFAVLVFLFSWTLLDHGFYNHGRIVDTPVYQGYGLNIRLGEVPYRDFPVVYPPGSLPVFLLPTYFGQPAELESYQAWFARLMAACGLACLVLVLLARPTGRAIAFVAISPLLVGQLMLSRYDLWPTLFLAAAVASFLHDRHRLGWVALALAFAAKLFAGVLLPVAAVWTYRRRGGRELARCFALWLVVVAVVFLPFAIIAPHGLWESLWQQLNRPLQVESLVAAFLGTFAHPVPYVSHGAVAIEGHGALAAATSILEVACLVALWTAFARGRVDADRFVRFSAACVCAFIAFGKVLSPQYLIWLVPLVPLVRGRRGLAATLLLGAAMAATQFWLSAARYARFTTTFEYAWLVLVRDLALVALVAILALPIGRAEAAPVE
jgi:Glycosyltransferase family 87